MSTARSGRRPSLPRPAAAADRDAPPLAPIPALHACDPVARRIDALSPPQRAWLCDPATMVGPDDLPLVVYRGADPPGPSLHPTVTHRPGEIFYASPTTTRRHADAAYLIQMHHPLDLREHGVRLTVGAVLNDGLDLLREDRAHAHLFSLATEFADDPPIAPYRVTWHRATPQAPCSWKEVQDILVATPRTAIDVDLVDQAFGGIEIDATAIAESQALCAMALDRGFDGLIIHDVVPGHGVVEGYRPLVHHRARPLAHFALDPQDLR